MRIHSKYFDQEFHDLYQLHDKVDKNGYVYCEVKLGMYGLNQAAILVYLQLKEHLVEHGYHPCKETTGLWRHKTRKTVFSLCIDDIRVKYFNRDEALHLINALKMYYGISND